MWRLLFFIPFSALAQVPVSSPCPQRLSCHAWVGGYSGQAEVDFQNREGNYLERVDAKFPSPLLKFEGDLTVAKMTADLNTVSCPASGSVEVTLHVSPAPEFGTPFEYTQAVRFSATDIELKRGPLNVHCGVVVNVSAWKDMRDWPTN